MKEESATVILKRTKNDFELAEEIINGRLKVSISSCGISNFENLSNKSNQEEDDVLENISTLIKSALDSGKLRSLARAVILAWQAEFESEFVHQAESKLVRKAKEVKLLKDFRTAIQARDRFRLYECIQVATELGMDEESMPSLKEARRLEDELELEVRRIQEVSRPIHNELFASVIEEITENFYGLDIKTVQARVEREIEKTNQAMKLRKDRLKNHLAMLYETKIQKTSGAKLCALQHIEESLKSINPIVQEQQISSLRDQVENLRAVTAELHLKLRKEGEKLVEVDRLRARLAELEHNEQVHKSNLEAAAEVGARWMEEKKGIEINELRSKLHDLPSQLRQEIQDQMNAAWAKKCEDLLSTERRMKVIALEGMETALLRRSEAQVAELQDKHAREINALRQQLANTQNELDALSTTHERELKAIRKELDCAKSSVQILTC